MLIIAALAIGSLVSSCGGGGAGMPGAGDEENIAPENENQGSLEEEEQQAPEDEEEPAEPEEEEEDEEPPLEYGLVDDIEIGPAIPGGPGPLEKIKQITLHPGENVIDHWNYARSGGFNVETEETFAGRELYLEAAYVEYDFVGLSEHWAIEAIEVRGFGNAVAGLWSDEFGFFWENSTMYLDSDSTVLQFYPNDHIDNGTAKLRLRTWNYSETMDTSIYEVRIYVKNNIELQQADDLQIGLMD
jgi:hypothetical protein